MRSLTCRLAPTGAVLIALVAALLVPLTLADMATAPGAQAAVKKSRVQYAIKNRLKVGRETNRGYGRAKFNHWIDANGDCQDTRSEVLRQESKVGVTGTCTVRSGKWFSYYDRRTWRQASDVDIDHLVPLHESWGSGAKRWNANTRKRFANDLRDGRALVAVTDNVNQSKGAGDPDDWLPRYGKCRYVRDWVAVKLRWRLKINRPEKRALLRVQSNCRNKVISWRPAKIGLRSSGGGDNDGDSITRGLRITKIVYNPDGDERYSPNKERVYIKNVTGSAKNLRNVVLSDTSGHRFKMPGYRLGSGRTVIVHSGSGTNGSGHLFARWNTAVWNNSGDTARVKAADGTLIDRCSYAGGGVTAYC